MSAEGRSPERHVNFAADPPQRFASYGSSLADFTPTDELSSDAHSSASDSGLYKVIEYDPSMNHGPIIADDSPAAEALRANANVHVSRTGKAARAMHMQSVRKFVKRATGATKSGVVRGKPPRLPPEEALDELPDEEVMPDAVVAGTAEAGKEVLGTIDPHDMLKLMRWRSKKNGDVKMKPTYVKGKVINYEHELYTLSIAVMIGVRTSIAKTNEILNTGPKRWVIPQDFRTTEKYEFRPKGGPTPPHQLSHTFKFKDYCPVVFAYLRRMYGCNEFDFLLSVCGNPNFIEFISNAKSGQFFFYSADGKYMIKTMTNAESRFLRRILPDYFKHCCENPNTMITRFFGMYRVKLYHLRRNVKFVIMNSVYYTDKYLQAFYDLKGSVLGRNASPGQTVKKDNDLRRGLPEDALALPAPVRERVRNQILSDCNFLQQMGIMDYSMLVGVHHIPPEEDPSIATVGFRPGNHTRRGTLDSEPDIHGDHPHTLSDRTTETGEHPLLSEDDGDDKSKSDSPDRTPTRAIRNGNNTLNRRMNDQFGGLFEDQLDDDESSYLMGSPNHMPLTERHASSEDTEVKKQQTIEKLYWPFHRFFDIHGHRLISPTTCSTCSEAPCSCTADEGVVRGCRIPRFVPPLSDRKDAGLEMDLTGLVLPLKFKAPTGETQLYEGKIFYMGIIDILQEYNSRKKLEATYRAFQVGRGAASCVPPNTYADRFDEFSQRKPADGVEIELELGVRESQSSMAEY